MYYAELIRRRSASGASFLLVLLLISSSVIPIAAQSSGPAPKKSTPAPSGKDQKTQPQPSAPAQPQSQRRVSLSDRDNVTLSDVNVEIALDRRVIVMMAALNVAGYDYESGNRPLSALRKQVREDLQATSPALLQKLKSYFQTHRGRRTDDADI